jgi:tetratricopeptide (TPR) repeat protein
MPWTVLLALCTAIPLTISTVSGVAVAQDHDQIVQSLLAEARVAQSRGDFPQAAEAYRKAVALEPSIPELWANLGLMEHEAGKHQEAIKSFQQAARFNPSLFVPQLFLGLEYLQSNKAEVALPYLENAVRLNPKDLQAVRSLGKAHAMLGESEKATELYWKALQLDPQKGDLWFDVGTSYLQQVETDARLMTSAYRDSPFVKLRSAEVLAAEGKLIDAEGAYRTAIAFAPPVPCGFAEFGITLLRQQKIAAAREQFQNELQTGSHCGLAGLGRVIADVVSGDLEAALRRIAPIANSDEGFIRSSLPLFRGALTTEQVKSLVDTVRTKPTPVSSVDLASLIEGAFLSDETPPELNPAEDSQSIGAEARSLADAERYAAEGQYSGCADALKATLQIAGNGELQLLASCSFYAADYKTASLAAQRLQRNPETRAQGLYWESKADQNLAIQALARAGEIDADSPRMHVLLGDVFREKRGWEEAEAEYRKAVALDPKSHSARLSLAITLFTELKNDEAFDLDESLLKEDAADQEANLLAGEILVQRNQFSQAEPYLLKCVSLKPEFLPRYHALLGKVYAETGRVPAAIEQYNQELSTDQDGSIHYQLARLYQKSGNKAAAEEAFKESKRLVNRWNDRARVVLEQMPTDTSRQ